MKFKQENTTLPSVKSVRCLERGLDLLYSLENSRKPLSVKELAASTGIPKPTVQRLLGVLERRRLVERERGWYQLGASVVPLARSFLSGNRLAVISLPIMEELVRLGGESVSLQVRDGNCRLIIQRVEGPHPLRYAVPIGQRLPLYVGAAGLVLISAMSQAELQTFWETVPSEIWLATGAVQTKDDLMKKIAALKQHGYIVAREERIPSIVSIAAPVYKSENTCTATLTVTGPVSRVTEDRVGYFCIEVPRAAQEISDLYTRL